MARRNRRKTSGIDVSPAAVEIAVQEFLAKGGSINRLPPGPTPSRGITARPHSAPVEDMNEMGDGNPMQYMWVRLVEEGVAQSLLM